MARAEEMLCRARHPLATPHFTTSAPPIRSPVIKYLGSKRLLLPAILQAIRDAAPDASCVLDVFSGTSRVGHALKHAGYRVIANDHNAYAHALATCYVQADRETHANAALEIIAQLNALEGHAGYFTETFCHRARYIHPSNGQRIDAIRDAIGAMALPAELEAIVLVSLMEAADRVDSTTGVQMAYLKSWAPRALTPMQLRLPDLLPQPPAGRCAALKLDALDAARAVGTNADVAYVDPPYNQHSYLGNYHVWESLVLWDKPETYGVACKRIDCKLRRSPFNSRKAAANALYQLLHALRTPTIVLSFSDEGHITRPEVEAMLATLHRGNAHVNTIAFDYKRYVGAQIGIHNPQGQKVGSVSHLRNTEYLYVVTG